MRLFSDEEILPIKRRKIRKRKNSDQDSSSETSSSSKSKMYFNEDTQKAIVEYQNTDNQKEKNEIYLSQIYPAFEKLAENLINIHKFTGLYDSYDDLKNDCINFLFEKIYKFNGDKGTNAFSYFNVVAKNWLIIKTKQKALKTKKTISLEDSAKISYSDSKTIEDYNFVDSTEDGIINFEEKIENINVLYSIRERVKNTNELSCINAIITIFENIESLDLTSKSAIFFYIKEISGLTPKQLSTTMQSMKKYFKKSKKEIETETEDRIF